MLNAKTTKTMKKVVRLKNITCRPYKGRFMVFHGKGTGSCLISFQTYEDVLKFDELYPDKVEYKHITCNNTGKEGAAWFIKGTNKMLNTDHPFYPNFSIES